jgi:hypothetical protein
VRAGVLGIQLRGFYVVGDGLGEFPLAVKRVTPVVLRKRQVRVDLQGLLVVRNSSGDVALVKERVSPTDVSGGVRGFELYSS